MYLTCKRERERCVLIGLLRDARCVRVGTKRLRRAKIAREDLLQVSMRRQRMQVCNQREELHVFFPRKIVSEITAGISGLLFFSEREVWIFSHMTDIFVCSNSRLCFSQKTNIPLAKYMNFLRVPISRAPRAQSVHTFLSSIWFLFWMCGGNLFSTHNNASEGVLGPHKHVSKDHTL